MRWCTAVRLAVVITVLKAESGGGCDCPGGGADLTSAEVLLICGEPGATVNGARDLRDPPAARGDPLLRLARWEGGDGGRGVRRRKLLALLGDVDDGAFREAEVAAEVVDALHPSFAGVLHQGTLIDVCEGNEASQSSLLSKVCSSVQII